MHTSPSYISISWARIKHDYIIPNLKIMSLIISPAGDDTGALSSRENLFLTFNRLKYLV